MSKFFGFEAGGKPNESPPDNFQTGVVELQIYGESTTLSFDKLDVQASGLKPGEDPNRLLLNKLRTAALESGPEEHPNELA